jgi:hypothetical protein
MACHGREARNEKYAMKLVSIEILMTSLYERRHGMTWRVMVMKLEMRSVR